MGAGWEIGPFDDRRGRTGFRGKTKRGSKVFFSLINLFFN